MKRSNSTGKVIWAVDATASDKRTQFATFRALAQATAGSGCAIEPVTVLSPDQLKVPAAAFQSQSKEYTLGAERLLKKWVAELKDPRLMAPTLLAQSLFSPNRSIDEILNYARTTGAKLIGVGTHSKRAWERFLIGSFAETMILKSEIPLLVVNPKSKVASKITKILFPTDFSTASEAAYTTLLATAKALKAKVTLYYKFDYIIPETVSAMRLTPAYLSYLESDIAVARAKASQWVEQAKQAGVKAEFILDEKPNFVADAILKTAKKSGAHLIAMASNSGTVASAFLGSVARQVVRSSPIPLWVIHPMKSATTKKTSERKSITKLQSASGNLT